jgi:hypothetical protein
MVSRVLIEISLLQHPIGEVDELLGIQLVTNILILSHIVEQREDLLSAGIETRVKLFIELSFHQQVEYLGFVLHKHLVVRILANCVKESNDTFIQFHLMIVGEVDNQRVINCLCTEERFVESQFFDVHHIG